VSSATHERLFGYQRAFDHPVTTMLVLAIVVALIAAPLVFVALQFVGRVGPSQQQELWRRYRSWLVLILVMLGPVLLGAAWTILFVFLLSLLCFREFARATGLFREKVISLVVVLGVFALYFAVLDHWYDLFVALFPLTIGAIALATVGADRPRGYIQRVALGVLGYALFGSGLAHLGYMANDTHYRPQIILILLAVEANDVFAYTCGKAFGQRKLVPHTSP
jgi:phosphatidate cytidylyltransferase